MTTILSDSPTNHPEYPEARRASVAGLRSDISETLNRVGYAGGRVIIHRRGKPTAGLVSMADLELLRNVEDRYWAEEGLRAITESGISRSRKSSGIWITNARTIGKPDE